jgi:hypothetical protein
MSLPSIPCFLAQEFHDIAPPVDYSLIPTWLVFVGLFFLLSVIGGLVWLYLRRRKPVPPPLLPRDRALNALEHISAEVESTAPYQFSIGVSDILRAYVTEQFGLPVTRQTSVEFLERLRKTPKFSAEENALLEDFLNRCDLIKFARYDATTADSCLLLEEALRFVQGRQFANAIV